MQPSLCRWNTERERNTVDIISRMVAKLKPRAVIPWEHVFLPTVYLLFLLRRPANSFSFHMCWKMETWTCLWHLHNTDECVFMSIFFQHRMFPHFLFFFFLHHFPFCASYQCYRNEILFKSALTLLMLCWHICENKTLCFSNPSGCFLLRIFLGTFSSVFCLVLFPFPHCSHFPVLISIVQYCTAVFRNGNEALCGTVSKSNWLNISLNGPANVCRLFDSFIYLNEPRNLATEPRVQRASSPLDTCAITVAAY